LTPRGLSSAFASNEEAERLHSLDSFLLSRRRDQDATDNNEFKYMIFVWNGKEAPPLVKATTVTKGYELD